jgi:Na+-driven multidrug efflux pump
MFLASFFRKLILFLVTVAVFVLPLVLPIHHRGLWWIFVGGAACALNLSEYRG